MRGFCAVLMVAGVAACAPTVPDSGAGVGFDDYDTYLSQQQARDAQLRNQGSSAQAMTPEQETANAAVAAVRGTGGQPARGESVPAGVQNTSPIAVPEPDLDNPSISDEQDFQAVSSRQTIESDAARRRAQSAEYQVIAPTALPRRPGDDAPTPVEFALQTSHPVGQKVYRRSILASGKTAKACSGFSSVELAQDAFLKAGGPQKDKLGVDPDGDGYACGWNPAKYRGLVKKG
ncbi:hypothetical protein [Litoreibacter arenae]|uniref:Excalibur calcium-binding domain-containing protein n=1 Tax=Litoreibacter arenae DSM 19593 TaxID=1123360 RepID=S9QNA3_9RHOB|nr:hypothetical protein [Litoreibacter arenae]EPX81172.1 hypothetical protein thalar_00621 [Litoreibacter arenae DSM 19593]